MFVLNINTITNKIKINVASINNLIILIINSMFWKDFMRITKISKNLSRTNRSWIKIINFDIEFYFQLIFKKKEYSLITLYIQDKILNVHLYISPCNNTFFHCLDYFQIIGTWIKSKFITKYVSISCKNELFNLYYFFVIFKYQYKKNIEIGDYILSTV